MMHRPPYIISLYFTSNQLTSVPATGIPAHQLTSVLAYCSVLPKAPHGSRLKAHLKTQLFETTVPKYLLIILMIVGAGELFAKQSSKIMDYFPKVNKGDVFVYQDSVFMIDDYCVEDSQGTVIDTVCEMAETPDTCVEIKKGKDVSVIKFSSGLCYIFLKSKNLLALSNDEEYNEEFDFVLIKAPAEKDKKWQYSSQYPDSTVIRDIGTVYDYSNLKYSNVIIVRHPSVSNSESLSYREIRYSPSVGIVKDCSENADGSLTAIRKLIRIEKNKK